MIACSLPPVIELSLSMLKLAVHSPRMRAAVRLFRAFPWLGLAQRREACFLLAADAAHVLDSFVCHDENLLSWLH